jgi:DNA-binding cell septation regulator SpoVG
VSFVAASEADQAAGLLAYVSCTWNEAVRVDCLTVRRTREGGLYVAYQAKTDGRGRRRPFVRPIDGLARTQIERQVLAAFVGRRAS